MQQIERGGMVAESQRCLTILCFQRQLYSCIAFRAIAMVDGVDKKFFGDELNPFGLRGIQTARLCALIDPGDDLRQRGKARIDRKLPRMNVIDGSIGGQDV